MHCDFFFSYYSHLSLLTVVKSQVMKDYCVLGFEVYHLALRLTESAIIEKETINHSGGFAKSTTVIVNKEDDVDYYSDTETDDISDRIKVKEKEANENRTTDEIDEDSV